MKITVVGAGPGAVSYLTNYAQTKIVQADAVLATKRLFEIFAHLNPNSICLEIGELKDFIIAHQDEYKEVCVLASGDVGFFSIGKILSRQFASDDLEMVSGISSLQYFTAKLGIGYDDLRVVSLHGREESLVAHCSYNPKVFALTGGKIKANHVAAALSLAGLAQVKITVGENLGMEDERIVSGTATEIAQMVFADLAVMLLENPNFVDCRANIRDSEFIRGKSPMTKEAVRAISLSALGIKPTDLVLDIGAGTGSVTVELAYRANAGMVYALEKNQEAIPVIKENLAKFGAYNVRLIEAFAPEGLVDLPPMDKVFVGGTSGNLAVILEQLLEKNSNVRVVINAITLETLSSAITSMEGLGMEVEVMCVSIAKGEKVGHYHLMKGENPIYVISGAKPTSQIN